jgi:DNA repair protein RadA/Sms
MAKKTAFRYVCGECAYKSVKWEGKCSNCAAWNSFEELVSTASSMASYGTVQASTKLSEISQKSTSRKLLGLNKVDQLLGGGAVDGSVILIAGEPGIGKSTLLMQVAGSMSRRDNILYVSAEESISQLSNRATRLNVASEHKLHVIDTTLVEDIAATIETQRYKVAIVDSIQTIMSESSDSTSGSVSQVTITGQILARSAKRTGTILILVGHVTKAGNIAGPKTLEHLVDVVLNIEGDRFGSLRIIRSQKNRFGPTNELVIMDMTEDGLKPVESPSKELLKERQINDGSVVLAALDGNQPLLVEVQALVTPTNFGYPKRAAVGFDLNRLNLLVAMLQRRTKLDLSVHDIYLNIVGGFKLNDPGADLAVCMAIATASKGMQLKNDAAIFGEVGLGGEIRHVPGANKRLKEAITLGFKRVIGPQSAAVKNKQFTGVKNVRETLNNNLINIKGR